MKAYKSLTKCRDCGVFPKWLCKNDWLKIWVVGVESCQTCSVSGETKKEARDKWNAQNMESCGDTSHKN